MYQLSFLEVGIFLISVFFLYIKSLKSLKEFVMLDILDIKAFCPFKSGRKFIKSGKKVS